MKIVLWIAAEQTREKEKLSKKLLKLEKEIDGLKVKLEVGKLLGNEDDTALQGQIKKI
ncbi:hypothetical protein HanXRQr2_Chr04g0144841 [Helianthus annuus]|uniref:Uncharacterized protein n=1 Tax=Helianthus annuus TaxID=4232 RepID=A0A251UVH5_HELAN|nr:hypothetical protein HanXRQr2_Chr04g0144841 [Helianthus annuus]